MINPQTLIHLSAAITALQAAYNCCEDSDASHLIETSEHYVYHALRALADGQVASLNEYEKPFTEA